MPFPRLAAAGLLALLAGCDRAAPPTAATAAPATPPAEVAGPALFEDVTAASGVNFTYRNGEEAGNYAIIESLGGGVAVFDYDNDGRPDLFFPGGGRFEGQKVLGEPCKLYRNLGGFKFADVSAAAGFAKPLQYSHGASAFDFDNDGWLDLLVSGYDRLVLLRNVPDGKGGRTFADVTATAGLAGDRLWSTSTAWGDLDGDGKPEVYVCHYGNWGFAGTGPDGQPFRHPTDCMYDGKTRDVCQPARFTPLPHALYKNAGGAFADISATAVVRPDGSRGPLRKDGRGIGAVMADLTGDGKPDIYAANDTDDNFLYRNATAPGGRIALDEVGLVAGVARDDRGTANGSMGLGVGDYDRSGRPSLIVTNYESELPALYQNRSDAGRTRFAYATQASGLGRINGVFVSWGTGFADFDLNGWDDLTIASGHAIRHPHGTDRRQLPRLLLNDGGRLTTRAAPAGTFFAEPHNARGSAVGDLDSDGRPDLVVVRQNAPAVVLRNVADAAGKHWVGFTLAGKNRRDLVGTRVVVESASGTQTKFVKGGASYASTDDARLHFGLAGDATLRKVTVHWSHGGAQDVPPPAVDAYHEVAEAGSAKSE